MRCRACRPSASSPTTPTCSRWPDRRAGRAGAGQWSGVKPAIPNVLAGRYASSGHGRRLVARRTRSCSSASCGWPCCGPRPTLGVAVPDGAIEAYQAVVDRGTDAVDLDSIAARERVTRHDVKARIEEFAALAGHEQIHKGMTSRDLTENVEQLQVRSSLRARPGQGAGRAGPPGPPRGRVRRAGDGRPLAQRRRAGHHAGQAVRHRRRRVAGRARPGWTSCSPATRCAASRARSAPRRTCSTCSSGDAGKLAELERAGRRPPRASPAP